MSFKTCYKCGAPSLLSSKHDLCHFHEMEHQKSVAAAKERGPCRCGNMPRLASDRCGRCLEKDHRLEREREEAEEKERLLEEKMTRIVRREAKELLKTIAVLQKELKEERDRSKKLSEQLEVALMGGYTAQAGPTEDKDWDQDVDWLNCPHYHNYAGDD